MSGETTGPRAQVRLVIVGHVDHGKSTLIGRLLHDTGSLPEGKAEEVLAVSAKRGMPVEWSFVLDAFQAERDQAITIDTTRIWFRTPARDFVLIDAPGHREFLRNMVSGASEADAAILVVDAQEGMREQTRRHAYLLHILGVRQLIVVINKMDAVGFAEARFRELATEVEAYLSRIGMTALAMVPVVARDGDNLRTRSERFPWYRGDALLDHLDRLSASAPSSVTPLRLPVQDVYKFDERRIVVGRVDAGTLRVGDELVFSPTGRSARVATIESWNETEAAPQASSGDAVGFTLDEPIFVERGDVASHADGLPILSSVFTCRIFWLAGHPLRAGSFLKARIATREIQVTVEAVKEIFDTETLMPLDRAEVRRNEIALVVLRCRELLALDPSAMGTSLGRCVLLDGTAVVGGGLVDLDGHPDQRDTRRPHASDLYSVEHLLTAAARARRNGHAGAVVWLTGLSGAGKSTLAMHAERVLFGRGYNVYVLDGDNVRRGLNADLGFSPEDRTENIRRIGEVAALFADAGLVVITAFISPYRADRERARHAAPGLFHEVYVRADLETCEGRDPKGLYKRARSGALPEFTGISAPYEEPKAPELEIDTSTRSKDDCVQALVRYIIDKTSL